MPNLMKELKSEITRLACKEANALVAPVRKINAARRGLIAGLRRQVDAMQKELVTLKKAMSVPETAIQAKEALEGRFWITGPGVKALRKRLGLTQAQFGKLAGVSVPTVIKWEGSQGKAPIRRKTSIARMRQIRGLRKRQLAEMMGKAKAPKKPKARAKVKARAKARRKKAK